MPQSNKNALTDNWVSVVLVVMVAGLVVSMAYLIATSDGSSKREAGLEAFILSSGSAIASWLVTKIYAEATTTQRLRDHGVQIARSIMALKRQIDDLSNWVSEKRSLGAHVAPGYTEASLDHIEQTLKGFGAITEVALNGIAGVIGDAIDQFHAVMDQVARIRSEAEKETTQIQLQMGRAGSRTEIASLQQRIEEIESRSAKEVAQLRRSSPLPIPEPLPVRRVTGSCPFCRYENGLEILDRHGETRVAVCQKCQRPFNAHLIGGQVVTRAIDSAVLPQAIKARVVPVAAGPFQVAEAEHFLSNINLRVRPENVERIIHLILAVDKELQGVGAPRSPAVLQRTALADQSQLAGAGLSGIQVRTFLRAAYQGGAFREEPADQGLQQATFGTPYNKSLTYGALLSGFASGCVKRLATLFVFGAADLTSLAALLFGPAGHKHELVIRQLIENKRASPGGSIGAAAAPNGPGAAENA
jgi:hypothetical protein